MGDHNILVTGGAGFLGLHLSEKLLGDGHKVTILDNFQTGSIRKIGNLLSNPNLQLMRQSVTDPIIGEFSHIYNLASPASPPQYQKDPIGTFKTNVLGTLNVLEYARASGAAVLQASTSEVYGDPLVHPQSETYYGNVNPTGPRACYDEGKRGAEALLYDFHRSYNVRIRVARIFNTYGPGMDIHDGRVVSNFIVQALSGNEITIYGDGQQTRSFCYCTDLVAGLVALMNANDAVSDPVNLGNPAEISLTALAEVILDLTSSKSRISYRNPVKDDPRQRRPDITRAMTVLNWSPKIQLLEGLQRTIAYFRKEIAIRATTIAAAEQALV